MARPQDQILTTRVGLRFPEQVEFDTWACAGSPLARISDSSTRCLGDWVACGQDTYADGYQRTVEAVGLDYQTLRNHAWVARRFGWSCNELRLHVRQSRNAREVGEQPVLPPCLAVPPEQFGRWREAAEHSSSTFADWVVAALEAAAPGSGSS